MALHFILCGGIGVNLLQVALFQAFSPESNAGIANALTGGGVSAVILVLGILMIIKANKQLKTIKNTNKQEKNDVDNV